MDTLENDIYNYKVSDTFKKMFEQPTAYLGYPDFDGNETTQKIFINGTNKDLTKNYNPNSY